MTMSMHIRIAIIKLIKLVITCVQYVFVKKFGWHLAHAVRNPPISPPPAPSLGRQKSSCVTAGIVLTHTRTHGRERKREGSFTL